MISALRSAAVALAVVLAAAPAHAYRPFDSTDAAVAEHGDVELEIGPVGYLRTNHQSHFGLAEVVNVGVLPRWELVLQGRQMTPSLGASAPYRFGLIDTGVFVKTVLREGSLQGRSGLSIATEGGALLPTIHDDRGVGASLALVLSEQYSALTIHVNLQGARTRTGNRDLFASTVLEGPQSWPVRPVTELFLDEEATVRFTASVLVGFIARVSDRFALDAGSRLAWVNGSEAFEARTGLTWTFPAWR